MTDSNVIKALECLIGTPLKCRECPYSPRYQLSLCQQTVAKDALSLITRQKAENERLKKENNQFAEIGKMYSEIKSEARREFAERLKEKASWSCLSCNGVDIYETKQYSINATAIDNLLKEMESESE